MSRKAERPEDAKPGGTPPGAPDQPGTGRQVTKSRRGLLVGTAGAMGVAAAEMVARAAPARADNSQAVLPGNR